MHYTNLLCSDGPYCALIRAAEQARIIVTKRSAFIAATRDRFATRAGVDSSLYETAPPGVSLVYLTVEVRIYIEEISAFALI